MGKKKSGLYLPDNGRKASTGKFSTGDFSVDGKSFYYRDPFNPEANEQVRADRRGDDGSAEDNRNPNAYDYTNPLYDYSYGQVRDAAKTLDIGNVNSQDEVDQLLKQIRKGSSTEAKDFKDDYIDNKLPPRENSDTEVEIPSATSGDATAGDNSIASPISQLSGIDIAGDRNSVDQNNSIDQDQAGSFLDKYKLNLRDNSFRA